MFLEAEHSFRIWHYEWSV